MSVLQNPIVGRMKQKIGGVVMSTWKGINVMRGKPLTVANPKTDKQLMRRSALRQIVAIARIIVAALDLGFKEQAVKKSAFNAFCGFNLRNAFDYSAPPAATLVPGDILVAQGTITPTLMTTQVANLGFNSLGVTYPATATDPGQSTSDICIIAGYNATQGEWLRGTQTGATRGAAASSLTALSPALVVGDTVWIYTFFYNAASRKSSDSLTDTSVAA